MTLRPKKFLGQHFLHDENIARKIVDGLNPDIPLVIEIGPGKGVLSKYLLEDPRFDPWFIEIDREAVEYLKQLYPAISDRIIEADFLKLDLEGMIARPTPIPSLEREGSKSPCERSEANWDLGVNRAQGKNNRQPTTENQQPEIRNPEAETCLQILGNFPYNISSQILFRVLEYRDLVQEVTGMFQKEVAQRISSPPGSKAYGILSVLMQAFYRIEYLFTVNESVFFPPPKVKSAVIRMVRNDVQSLDCDEKFWIKLVKTAFNQRRKTLRNSLRKISPPEYTQLNDPLFDLRPEQLPVSDFVRLARMLDPESSEKK